MLIQWLPERGSESLVADESHRLVERGAAGTGVSHRGVLVPDRHAAEEDEPIRGRQDLGHRLTNLRPRYLRATVQPFGAEQ